MKIIAAICWRIALDPESEDPKKIISELSGVIPDNDLSELQTKAIRAQTKEVPYASWNKVMAGYSHTAYLTTKDRNDIIYRYLKRKYL